MADRQTGEPGPRLHRAEPGVLAVEGPLTFESAGGLLVEGMRLLDGDAHVCLDLAGVTRADSAGLALLVEWQRAARRRGFALELRHMPAQLLAIARLTGLDGLLGASEAPADLASEGG